MRVLVTNNTLDARSGSELYVRDIALALLARGHEPIAYSRRLGEVARELRQATVSVVDDPEALSTPPDLIHAQHHLEAMTALARFPETPAIYVCHGWLPAEEAPPRHPRILRYVAVDELVRRRLVDECGIAPERVVTHLNFVDLERFPRRPPLPERPSRALVFSHQISEVDGLPEIRQACASAGLELDTLGRRMGTASAAPEGVLGRYDVVFAKARAAMEALAVGCVVVLCDAAGLGPKVTSHNFDRLRDFNFGVRLLREPIDADRLVQELEGYDCEDAHEVTRRLRDTAGLDHAVDRLLQLYDDVLAEHSSASYDREEESRAVSRYLRHGPLTGGDYFQQERAAYQAELARTGDYARSLLEHLQATREDQHALRSERERLTDALQESRSETLRLREVRARGEASLTDCEVLAETLMAQLQAAEKKREADTQREEEARGETEERMEQLRTELHSARRDLERQAKSLQEAGSELAWIKKSVTWRLRGKLASQGWLVRAYRAVRRRRS